MEELLGGGGEQSHRYKDQAVFAVGQSVGCVFDDMVSPGAERN